MSVSRFLRMLLLPMSVSSLLSLGGCMMSGLQARSVEAPAGFAQASKPVTSLAEAAVEVDPLDSIVAEPVKPKIVPVADVNLFGEFGDVRGKQPTGEMSGGTFAQHTFLDDGADTDVEMSPDGQWMLFSSTRHSKHSDIYIQRPQGTSITQLTDDPGDDAFPSFSPDGKTIAFASNRTGNWNLYLMNADGSAVRAVTRGFQQEIHPSFSPDGKTLAYSAQGLRSGQWEIWIVDIASGSRRMIGYGLFPTFSPDASVQRIAYQRARQRGSRWFSIWTLDVVEGEARNVTEVAFSTTAALIAPAWSHDGAQLAFASVVEPERSGAEEKVSTEKTHQDIWLCNADGSNRRRLTDGQGLNATPAWGDDGQIYFVSNRGGCEAIWSTPTQSAANYSTVAVPKN